MQWLLHAQRKSFFSCRLPHIVQNYLLELHFPGQTESVLYKTPGLQRLDCPLTPIRSVLRAKQRGLGFGRNTPPPHHPHTPSKSSIWGISQSRWVDRRPQALRLLFRTYEISPVSEGLCAGRAGWRTWLSFATRQCPNHMAQEPSIKLLQVQNIPLEAQYFDHWHKSAAFRSRRQLCSAERKSPCPDVAQREIQTLNAYKNICKTSSQYRFFFN